MAIDFDKVKDDLICTGKEVKDKAKEVSRSTKLKLDICSKKHELDQLYAALGRVYFTSHQHEENLPEEVMFNGIRRAERELAGLKEELKNGKDN